MQGVSFLFPPWLSLGRGCVPAIIIMRQTQNIWPPPGAKIMRPPRLLTLCALRFTHALKNMRIHPESAASPTVGQI